MSNIPFTISDRTCTVYVEGKPYTVDRSTQTFKKLVDALSNKNLAQMPRFQVETIKQILDGYGAELLAIQEANKGKVEVTRRNVLFNGEPVAPTLERRILDISAVGLPIDGWIAFVENLYQNPAEYAREELYDWLETADLPITEDGCFLAYKRVNDNFTDMHTGTFSNAPGTVVVMPTGRPGVDPIRDNTCSTGLHFCSKEYLPNFGSYGPSKVVLVKVNPADVVSIPSDYDYTKGRTWRYEVVAEVPDYENIEWAPMVAEDASPFAFDPQGDPIPVDDKMRDHCGREYVLGTYPMDLLVVHPDAKVVYPDRIGETIRLYTEDGGFDFNADFGDFDSDEDWGDDDEYEDAWEAYYR